MYFEQVSEVGLEFLINCCNHPKHWKGQPEPCDALCAQDVSTYFLQQGKLEDSLLWLLDEGVEAAHRRAVVLSWPFCSVCNASPQHHCWSLCSQIVLLIQVL